MEAAEGSVRTVTFVPNKTRVGIVWLLTIINMVQLQPPHKNITPQNYARPLILPITRSKSTPKSSALSSKYQKHVSRSLRVARTSAT